MIQGITLTFDLSFVDIGCLWEQAMDYLQQQMRGKRIERGWWSRGDRKGRCWLEVLVGGWNTAHWLRLFVDDDHGLRYLRREVCELRRDGNGPFEWAAVKRRRKFGAWGDRGLMIVPGQGRTPGHFLHEPG